jgi:hypothetical protein
MPFETSPAELVNDVAIELGLITAPLADPSVSTEPAIMQLIRLAKSVGRSLIKAHPWSQLQRTYTFTTTPELADYSLPDDFDRFLDQTGFNRTNNVGGLLPASGQGWQLLQAEGAAGAVGTYFRIAGNLIHLHPTPTAAETFAFEYVSNWWISVDDSFEPSTDQFGGHNNYRVWFDPHLFTRALKVAFLKAKGFDYSAAQDELNYVFGLVAGADGVSPVLYLSGGPGVHLLDAHNVPDTGFGE